MRRLHHRPRDRRRQRRCCTPTRRRSSPTSQIARHALRPDRDPGGARQGELRRRPRHRAGAADRIDRRAVPRRAQRAALARTTIWSRRRARRTASTSAPSTRRASPAAGGGYRLSPTRIDFGGGTAARLRLAGRYGGGIAAQARLDRLDLSILSTRSSPNLGVRRQGDRQPRLHARRAARASRPPTRG